MGIDGKYGRVTLEHSTIGEDEPVVVFRAQDRLLPDVLTMYALLCKAAGSPERHLDLINQSSLVVQEWQARSFTQTPQSAQLKEEASDA